MRNIASRLVAHHLEWLARIGVDLGYTRWVVLSRLPAPDRLVSHKKGEEDASCFSERREGLGEFIAQLFSFNM